MNIQAQAAPEPDVARWFNADAPLTLAGLALGAAIATLVSEP